MPSLGILYLLFVAVLITLVFSILMRIKGPWGNVWIFFVIILLAVLIAGIYIQPAGPVYRDIYWLPPLVVGILIALLLAATTPSPRTRTKLLDEVDGNEKEKEEADLYSLGIFFWVLFVVMLVMLAIGLFVTV